MSHEQTDVKVHHVIVNGEQKEVRKNQLTFHEVCKLGFSDVSFEDNIVYTVSFSYPDGTEGSMVKHESVDVIEEMIFHVSITEKGITIFINTREFTLHQKSVSYQELVGLAFPGDIPSSDKVYEITYSSDHGPDGKVGVGGDVKLKEGMVFNVGLTNRS